GDCMRTVSPALSGRAAGAAEAASAAGATPAAGAPAAAGDAAGADASTRAINAPLDTLSPRLSSTSAIVPAAVAGTSIEALSVSSVSSGEAMWTWSPGFTSTDTTATSPELPVAGHS